MTLLNEIKPLLGITLANTDFDIDIESMIAAAKADLKYSGIYLLDEKDPLINRAIKMYCKINFDYDEDGIDRLQKSYDMLKNHMSLSSDYNRYKVIINAGKQCRVTFDGITKETNQAGTVIFYSREKNHIKYIVDGEIYYTDITDNTEITV